MVKAIKIPSGTELILGSGYQQWSFITEKEHHVSVKPDSMNSGFHYFHNDAEDNHLNYYIKSDVVDQCEQIFPNQELHELPEVLFGKAHALFDCFLYPVGEMTSKEITDQKIIKE